MFDLLYFELKITGINAIINRQKTLKNAQKTFDLPPNWWYIIRV
jgi:hypothetical protein